jgi:hypothetical protein
VGVSRYVDVRCENEEELGRVLGFLWDRTRSGLIDIGEFGFPVIAGLEPDRTMACVRPKPEIRCFFVRVPKRILEAQAVKDTIESIKRGG